MQSHKQVTFYEGSEAPLIPTKGTDDDVCLASPHAGQPRCKHVAPQKESFKDYRCDKPQDHKGPCVSYERTMLGMDTSRFCVWRP
jgi:hypothetical protein